jgi:hypothetical protein
MLKNWGIWMGAKEKYKLVLNLSTTKWLMLNLVPLKKKKKERKRNYEDGEEHLWFIGWKRILTNSISKQEENVVLIPSTQIYGLE